MKRVAIVGCGVIAKTHGLAIQDLGFECVAVTDIFPEAAQSFAHHYPELRADHLTAAEWMTAPARTRLREMFREPKVYPNVASMKDTGPLDAIIIATLPPSHCELTCEAAAIGAKAVLCEKPMAMSVAQCQKMIEICKKQGSRLAVYHESMVLRRQFMEARQLVGSNQIGRVEFVRANTVGTLMDWSIYLWAGILHLLHGHTITTIDAMLDLNGKKVSFGHAQEDRATVHFMMDDNIHGMLFTGQNGFSRHGIRIDGSEGSIEISVISPPLLRHWRQGTRSWEVVTPPPACSYEDRREFLAGIVNGDPFYNIFDGLSALKSTLPAFAAWQSHQERRPISMTEPITVEIPLVHETATKVK